MIPLLGNVLEYSGGVLQYNSGGDTIPLYPYRGENLNEVVSSDMATDIMTQMKLESSQISSPGIGVYNITAASNRISLSKDESILNFENPSTVSIDLSELESAYESLTDKYDEIFADIVRGLGLYVKTESGVEEVYSKVVDDRGIPKSEEKFIPKDDTGTEYVRCFINKELDNTVVDLSEIYFSKRGESKKYKIIPTALIELTFDDHQICYCDLTNGVDLIAGIEVNDFVILSQRVIKKINIYYEVDKSLYIS